MSTQSRCPSQCVTMMLYDDECLYHGSLIYDESILVIGQNIKTPPSTDLDAQCAASAVDLIKKCLFFLNHLD